MQCLSFGKPQQSLFQWRYGWQQGLLPTKASTAKVSFMSCHQAHFASAACQNTRKASTPSSFVLASWFCSETSELLAGFENTK